MARISAALVLTAAALTATSLGARASRQARESAAQRAPGPASARVEVLRSVGSVPPEIVGVFDDPVAFQQALSGQYFVLDRRGHTVYGIDAARTTSWKIVQIGQESGRIIEPSGFDLEPTQSTFVVADAPEGRERVQIFGSGGRLLGGFTLPGRAEMRVVIDGLALSGAGSLRYTGHSVLMSQPETGALFTEFSMTGTVQRHVGTLRMTGQESDRDVHLALNAGIPLVNPRGGYYFVFSAGIPIFRKYDSGGTLVFERHIEGRELDSTLLSLPTRWPRRTAGEGHELPVVPPLVRAAAVDADGNLWLSMTLPYTYVYNTSGEKIRTVQFRGAGILAPTSLFFTHTGTLLVTPGCYEFRAGIRDQGSGIRN
jgi:DNA-binding beta-propeller fold protein YncE